jgi:hypothetical protein
MVFNSVIKERYYSNKFYILKASFLFLKCLNIVFLDASACPPPLNKELENGVMF